MRTEEKFLNYLTSLRSVSNTELLECVLKGYNELLEYNEMGSASPNMSNNPTYMDNQLNINPNSTGFQDNIMEDIDTDPTEISSDSDAKGNPEESYTNKVLGLESLSENGVPSGQPAQNAPQQPQETAPKPQNVPLLPDEIQMLQNYRAQKRANQLQQLQQQSQQGQQVQTEATLQEFSPPAGIIVGTSGPMVKDANPFESGGSEKDEKKAMKELYKQLVNALETLEHLINIQSAETGVDAEFIMEDKQ